MVLFEINKINSTSYSVPIHNSFFSDFLSLLHIESKKEKENHTTINCRSIRFLSDFLLEFQDELITYDYAYCFTQNIVKQLLYLEKQKKTVHALALDDFIIINNSFVVFVNFKKINDISDNQILVHSPYNKNNNLFFITKEMKDNKSLPLKLDYKNVYISLAYLIINCLYGKHYYDYKDNIDLISNLSGTKLYYFLKNCLSETAENRHICFF